MDLALGVVPFGALLESDVEGVVGVGAPLVGTVEAIEVSALVCLLSLLAGMGDEEPRYAGFLGDALEAVHDPDGHLGVLEVVADEGLTITVLR